MLSNSESINARLVEIESKNFYKFLSTLQGSDYRAPILKQYPETEFDFPKPEKLPYVGEDKVWVCDCGCGERDPIMIPYATSSRIGKDGVISAVIEGIWVSPCVQRGSEPEYGIRHEGMDLWDLVTDDYADPAVRLEAN